MDRFRSRRGRGLVGASGLIAVGLYVGATVLGGVLDPHYSQIGNSISQLTATGAPSWSVEAPLYAAYNLVLFGFSVAIYRTLSNARRLTALAVVFFAIGAIAGLGQVTFFRQDPGGIPVTVSGLGHIILAAVSSLLTVVSTLVYGFAFRRDATWRKLSSPSFGATAALLLSGPAAALTVTTAYAGLFERVTIGVFMLWVVVVSVFALGSARIAGNTPSAGRLSWRWRAS
jgi:hypothetical protein